jgi:hypothetical protein
VGRNDHHEMAVTKWSSISCQKFTSFMNSSLAGLVETGAAGKLREQLCSSWSLDRDEFKNYYENDIIVI